MSEAGLRYIPQIIEDKIMCAIEVRYSAVCARVQLVSPDVGRIDSKLRYFRGVGGDRHEMLCDGLFIAVAEVRCRYRAPVFYDEEVIVRTWLKAVRESVIKFSYELARAKTGAVLAEGETTHIVTNSEMKVSTLPDKYLSVFRAAAGK